MRSKLFLGVAVVLLLLVGGAVGVAAYDGAREDTIASGVAVGGVDLGGLSRAEARRALEAELADPLRRPVVVTARGREFRLTDRTAELEVDLDAMVSEALARSRDGEVLSRTWRGLTGGEVRADLEPDVRFSSEAVGRYVRRIASRVDRPARDAKVAFSDDGVQVVRARTGVAVDRAELRRRVSRALARPEPDARRLRADLETTRPKVGTARLAKRYGTLLAVDRAAFRLRLYKGLKLVRTYPIAVGAVGLDTPAGLYEIQNKAVDPAWNVPNSAWAGDLAGQVIPPGPQNPIKARWLGVYDGVGVHGTDARSSIGTNASHGCIRMLVEDVIDLYDRVPVGTPIHIA